MSSFGERIEPLRALLYDREQVGDLRKVVAPPYDLINERQQNELYERSPYNIVRLELARDADRYAASAATMTRWRRDGALRFAPRPAIYHYVQEFGVDGGKLRRTGLIVRIRLEEFSTGAILPHEKTFPAAKQDRLQLLQALEANVSSIFGLYPGTHPELAATLRKVAERDPFIDIVDDLGIRNQLRAIEEPDEIDTVQRALATTRVLIADGHHRYETALNYRRMRRQAEGDPKEIRPYDYTMMTLVAFDDPGLVILPTHRVVAKLDAGAANAFVERAREAFEITETDDHAAFLGELSRRGRGTLGVALRDRARPMLLKLRSTEALAAALPDTPPAVRELDVSILHALVLDRIFGIKGEEVRKGGNIEYTIDGRGALAAVAEGRAEGAFLMNPPSIGDVERVCLSGATMPEKSTYFHPKLLTGLVLNPLDAR